VEDVSHLLSRQFGEEEIGEVVALINQLFSRTRPGAMGETPASPHFIMAPSNRRRLH